MKSLKETIMERDGLTSAEADELIEIARQMIYEENDDPEEVTARRVWFRTRLYI
jgi:hypothetical protein